MQKESLSDALIEYLKTDATLPLFFPPRLRGSCANLFLNVIRHQNIREPNLVVKTIAQDLQKKRSYRQVEAILMTVMRDSLDEVIGYASNRIIWDQLSPDDKAKSRTATAKMMHVRVMRQEIDYQKEIIMK